MKIKTIEVRRTHTFGNYENISLSYVADLDDGEDVDKARAALIARIEGEIQTFADRRDMYAKQAEERSDMEHYELPRLRSERDLLQKRIDAMIEFLSAHGVDTSSYELPF